MYINDTIAAISTPLGEGGIGIIRLSGVDAVKIADRLFSGTGRLALSDVPSHTIHHGFVVDPANGQRVDEVLVTVMRAPRTYTREDVVEINCHGGLVPVRRVLELVLANGARLAEPGEFTKRAFLNGRLDLAQAEAVIDLIRAKTDDGMKLAVNHLRGDLSQKIGKWREKLLELLAHIEAAIDFPEHDIPEITAQQIEAGTREVLEEIKHLLRTADTGKIYREGLQTVIVGKPNVGKSSLLNALLREKRAIVTAIPGTTRDVIEEILNLSGIPLKIVDTAGIHETEDLVEKIGVERTREFLHKADLVLLVLDASLPLATEDYEIMQAVREKNVIVLVNKTDLPEKIELTAIRQHLPDKPLLKISLLEGTGLAELEKAITELVFAGQVVSSDTTMVTNVRHKDALTRARNALAEVLTTLEMGMPVDCLSIDLKTAWEVLGEITGETIGDDLVEQIFSQFCIGK